MSPAKGGRNVLVTGGAGFIGSHLIESLLQRGDKIVILDNFNTFYDPTMKERNIAGFRSNGNCTLVDGDIRDDAILDEAFSSGPFDCVVHLAAMAGVRPSLQQPALYMDVNVNGTQKIIDKILPTADRTRFVFGSSSSVYGARSGESFKETDRVDLPISPYAASKAANELQCYAAHHSGGLKVVALRFFTVFGPRQRPDLAIHKFCNLIHEGKPIEVYGDGTTKRDYTYVADIVRGIESAMEYPLDSGYDIINLGRSDPVELMEMIRLLEKHLNIKAKMEMKEMQTGDVPFTYANIDKARKLLGYEPTTTFEEGIKKFVAWFIEHKRAVSTAR